MRTVVDGLKLAGTIVGFARQHKAYWIVPIFIVLALVAVLMVVSQSALPFIYTLF